MGHEEAHRHEHEHGHRHHHGEELPGGMSEQEKRKTMLGYLLSHNEHHAEEIREMAEALAADGCAEAAELIRQAAESFKEGNEKLKKAAELL